MKDDAKDAVLRQQMETIRVLTENRLRQVNTDFWGSPAAGEKTPPEMQPPKAEAKPYTVPPQSPETAPPEKLEDLLEELDGYVGLRTVKAEVRSLVNLVKVAQMRRDHGLPTEKMSLHMVFSGNPGTGKTTIARLMARIYHSLGILSKGQLVEVDRSGLVAGYVGQTALKTGKVIESALGGVLFIDEAYALTGGQENDFGQEAVDTVLKAMEDHREDLVVIMAGYTALMERLIHSNPGLESRFNRFLEFPDYSLEEMMEILDLRCRKAGYTMDEKAREAMAAYIQAENTDSETFGNARGVRNLFEKVLVQQANRLAAQPEVTREDLQRLTAKDVAAARQEVAE